MMRANIYALRILFKFGTKPMLTIKCFQHCLNFVAIFSLGIPDLV